MKLNKKICLDILLSIIFLVFILFFTNPLWLMRKSIDVSFDLIGKGEKEIEFFVGNQKRTSSFDLSEQDKFFAKFNNMYYARNVKLVFSIEDKDFSTISIKNLKVGKKNIKCKDLVNSKVSGADVFLKKDNLVITPKSQEIVITYPIKIRPTMKFKFVNFAIFLLFSVFLIFYKIRYSKEFYSYLLKIKELLLSNKKLAVFAIFLAVVFTILTPHWWVKSEYWENKYLNIKTSNINIDIKDEFVQQKIHSRDKSQNDVLKDNRGKSLPYLIIKNNKNAERYIRFKFKVSYRYDYKQNFINFISNVDGDAILNLPKDMYISNLLINGIDLKNKVKENKLQFQLKKDKLYDIDISGGYFVYSLEFLKAINYFAVFISFIIYYVIFMIVIMKLKYCNMYAIVKRNKISILTLIFFFVIYYLSNNFAIYNTDYLAECDVFLGADSNKIVENILFSTQRRFHPYFFIIVYPIFDIISLLIKDLTLVLRLIYCGISALTLVFMYKSLCLILPKNNIINILLTLIFGFSYSQLVMTYAFEVYPITALLLSILLYLVLKNIVIKHSNTFCTWLLAFIIALSFGVTVTNVVSGLLVCFSLFHFGKMRIKNISLFLIRIFSWVFLMLIFKSLVTDLNIFSYIVNNLGYNVIYLQNFSYDVFVLQTLMMPLINPNANFIKIVMLIFWTVFVCLVFISLIYSSKNYADRSFKLFFNYVIFALVLNFVFGYIWSQNEGFLFALNHLELWFIVFASCIKIINERTKLNRKFINKILSLLLFIILFLEVPTNYIANKKVQEEAMKKYPLTYSIIEVNK